MCQPVTGTPHRLRQHQPVAITPKARICRHLVIRHVANRWRLQALMLAIMHRLCKTRTHEIAVSLIVEEPSNISAHMKSTATNLWPSSFDSQRSVYSARNSYGASVNRATSVSVSIFHFNGFKSIKWCFFFVSQSVRRLFIKSAMGSCWELVRNLALIQKVPW